jgi:hypothetical protein
MSNALGQTVRSFGRFIRTPWFAAAVPILTLIYGVGDHYGFWDYARGRTAIIRSLDRLASGEGYPVSFIQQSDPDFYPLYRFIKQRTTNRDISTPMLAGRRSITITRLGGGERVIPTPREFPKTVIVPMESPVLFVYDLSESSSPRSAYAQVATLRKIDEWIKATRETELMWVTVVLVNFLAVAMAFIDKPHSSSTDGNEEESR